MIIKFDYLEHKLEITPEIVNSLEIENKQMLCRVISDIYSIETTGFSENICFLDKNYKEINVRKIKIITDFFSINEQIKKYTSDFMKIMIQNLDDKCLNEINNLYKKNNAFIEKIIEQNDFPLEIEL